ncbi:hypothetical protein [Bradyrhizobium sp.]|jgi:hypothetical protein|uniref:hypothetical protein n=1 Tax=Bradyrhizobium sp. TaxID=376 RepID=UPI002E18278F
MVSSRVHLLFFVLIGGIIAWNLYAYPGVNWELLATKHYFADHYYGGYANSVLTENAVPFTIQLESWPCLAYVASSLMPDGDAYLFSLQVDRIYTCGFLPSLVVRLLGGHIHLSSAIVATNFLFWAASIVLTYGVVGAWSKNRTAALIGAMIAAGYPIYGLMLQSWKTQDAGPLLMLAWIYIDKAIWPRLGWIERAVLLGLTFTVTTLASGAAYYIFVYIISWYLYLALFEASARREACLTIVVTVFAMLIGKVASGAIMNHSHIMSMLSWYRVDRIVADSIAFLRAALSGGDTSSLRFLNFAGFSFVTTVLPWFASLCFKANPVIVIVPLVGLFFLRQLRPLIFAGPALFLMGHATAVVTGWMWYYAYSSAPAVHLLIAATAVCLGLLFESKLSVGRPVSAIALLVAVYFFNASPAFNFKNFYTDDPVYLTDRRLYVYHDDRVIRYW